MKYYLHDSNSFQDEKISELYINFGYEGLGLYYTLLEKLALQEKPVKTIVLKKQLNIGKRLNKCWLFLEQIDLVSSNNGETFSKTLLNFSEKYQIKKEKNRKRISEWRSNQDSTKNVTCNEQVRNTHKVKRSKVKESNNNNILFNTYWNSYHSITMKNKTDKESTLNYWKKLTELEKQKAIDNIKSYYNSLNDKKYCKKARTYLSDKNFNDEFKQKIIVMP